MSNPVNHDTQALITFASTGASTNSADQKNAMCRGIKVVVNIAAISGTAPTLTVTIQGRDVVSGVYFTLLASAALTTTGTTVLTVYPGMVAAANSVANDILPGTWRISAVTGGTLPVLTATIAASVVV